MADKESSTDEKAAETTAEPESSKEKPPAKRNLEEENEDSIHKQPVLALVRYYLPETVHRPIIRVLRKLKSILSINQGEWQWLEQRPLPLKMLNRSLWRTAEPSVSYFIMLSLSGIIAALGLLAGSTAAIIGAMIVAPLMGPIVGMAFAITMGNRRLLKRAGLSVFSGSVLTIMTAYFICKLLGISTLNSEILERTSPTLIDLAIGLAAGAAGSFAKTRREVADALPGVAIAVALVPPLGVMGIGLAMGSREIFFGSTLLYFTNLGGMLLSGGLIFIWQDYGSIKRAKRGLTASTAVVVFLGIPLGISMRDLIVEERARAQVDRLIREETETFANRDIRRLRIHSKGKNMRIDLEVAAPEGEISSRQIDLVHRFIEKKLERPVTLDVSVFAVQDFEVEADEKEADTEETDPLNN